MQQENHYIEVLYTSVMYSELIEHVVRQMIHAKSGHSLTCICVCAVTFNVLEFTVFTAYRVNLMPHGFSMYCSIKYGYNYIHTEKLLAKDVL